MTLDPKKLAGLMDEIDDAAERVATLGDAWFEKKIAHEAAERDLEESRQALQAAKNDADKARTALVEAVREGVAE